MDGTEFRGPVDLAWEPDRITGVTPAAQDGHDGLCVLPGLVGHARAPGRLRGAGDRPTSRPGR
ncbi:hypothetical protein GCM10020220_073450 [Nonomuraea rubra]|uniref:hypothetical protein n=1 Tax=Nonomuraea rubra TaxID=46180 RepID=UPI0031EC3F6F